jgi:hypothetical protein
MAGRRDAAAPCTNCGKPVYAKGLCASCYMRQRRNGTLDRVYVDNRDRQCAEPGCGRRSVSHGYCHKHYVRMWRQKAIYKTFRTIEDMTKRLQDGKPSGEGDGK